jgi:hypothetical protein
MVRIGVGLHPLYLGHDQTLEAGSQRDEVFHRSAAEGQELGCLLGRELQLRAKGPNPSVGNVHGRANWLKSRTSFS